MLKTPKYKFPILEESENVVTTLQIYVKDNNASFEDILKQIELAIKDIHVKGFFEDSKVKIIKENFYPYLKQ